MDGHVRVWVVEYRYCNWEKWDPLPLLATQKAFHYTRAAARTARYNAFGDYPRARIRVVKYVRKVTNGK